MTTVLKTVLRVLTAAAVFALGLFVPQEMAWGAPETRISPEQQVAIGEVMELSWPSTHVGVRWSGDRTAVVEIQGAKANGIWSEWVAAEVDDLGEEEQSPGLVLVDDAVKLRARVVSGEVSELRLTAIDAENGPRRLQTKTTVTAASAVEGLTPQPHTLRRAEWGADESLRKAAPAFAKASRILVHHTATSNTDPNPAATVRAIYSWHTQGNGWSDIGYNYLIDRAGKIYEGRYSRYYAPGQLPTGDNSNGSGVIGAHTAGHNTGAVGIAMLGTYSGVAPTTAQQDALTKLIAWSADKNNIDPMAPGAVLAHRDLGQTTCPGNAAYVLMGGWRQKAATIKMLATRPGNTPGYWLTAANGDVKNFGTAQNFGTMAGKSLNAPVISLTRTPSNNGYWLLGADGGVFSFGDAQFHGSTGGIRLNQPVVGMAATPSGKGYWLVAKDGGIFTFGDAKFFGSTGAMRLNQPVMTMAATPSGSGYWLAASDGGIFTFGDAPFHGSTGSLKLNSPITTMAATSNGYYLFAGDGGVFSFNSVFYGSVPMMGLPAFSGAVRAAVTSTGRGYYVLARDGSVYTFGDARFHGSGVGAAAAAGISVMPE